jgi:hypothetical protein
MRFNVQAVEGQRLSSACKTIRISYRVDFSQNISILLTDSYVPKYLTAYSIVDDTVT